MLALRQNSWSFTDPLRLDTKKLSPNRQIGRILAIPQDGLSRTMPLGVAWDVPYLVGNEKSFCRGQVEGDQCLVN